MWEFLSDCVISCSVPSFTTLLLLILLNAILNKHGSSLITENILRREIFLTIAQKMHYITVDKSAHSIDKRIEQ